MSEYDQDVRIDYDTATGEAEFVFTDTAHKPHGRRNVLRSSVQIQLLDYDETQSNGDNTLRLVVEEHVQAANGSVRFRKITLRLLPAAREALLVYLANPGNRKAAIR